LRVHALPFVADVEKAAAALPGSDEAQGTAADLAAERLARRQAEQRIVHETALDEHRRAARVRLSSAADRREPARREHIVGREVEAAVALAAVVVCPAPARVAGDGAVRANARARFDAAVVVAEASAQRREREIARA